MFKKRTRPASVRDKPEIKDDEPTASEATQTPIASGSNTPDVETGDETGRSIDELILLRKLRKSRQGIDLERFNRGEAGKFVEREDASVKYGMQSVKGKGRADEREPLDEDDKARLKRMVRSNNFTQQTNALDVDRHMLAYIEEELAKRKGNTIREGEEVTKPYDPQAELFQIVEKYKLDNKVVKEVEEGSVTNSLGMLTSIPEVDLGMENRLRNIEATEKAKREMLESRRNGEQKRRQEDHTGGYATSRYAQQRAKIASDGYAVEEAKREAAGLLPPNIGKPRIPHEPRHEAATDEQVYDRFKKRMKR